MLPLMDNSKRLAALWLSLLSIGAATLWGIDCGTRAPAPAERQDAPRNHRYLMQSKADPSRWEALEVLAEDPSQFYRTELSAAQARRWAAEGGFRWVSNQEFNDRLAIAGGYRAAKARPAPAGARILWELETTASVRR